ncbi:unnamed protein product [Paramecium sonneborni]|uniref:Ankyrin repeat protein n=1 Tax=Paramecium sonneborni TaxID=65129 RepID=A0A8S1LS07_9CILI|nr:unnamed protein product [Paramecium sonneborni]
MQVNGQMINNMEMELKPGQIILFSKDYIKWGRNMVMENFNGKMVLNIQEILIIIQSKVMENTLGLMVENILDLGRIIKWMVKEYLHGQMEEDIRVNIKMIKKMDKENLNGLMEEFIVGNGRMENNMELEFIQENQILKNKEFGNLVKELDGFIKGNLLLLNEYIQFIYIYIYLISIQIIMNSTAQVLFLKVEQGNVNKVIEILQQYPNLIDLENVKSGQTCLTIACRKNDGPMIEKLIAQGADINKTNRLNQSPLWICSFYNYRRTADFLLNHGADVNQQDKKGFSPLMIAAQRGNLETVALLLNAKANIQLLNKNQDTVFDVCKDYETLQFMIQTLQIDEVRVKQPDKFKPKSQQNANSMKSTQTKFSNNSNTKEQSEFTPNLNIEQLYTIQTMINSICEEMQLIFNEAIQIFKESISNINNLTDAKKAISIEYEKIQQSQNIDDNIQFQYDNFQYEITRQIGRTLYSIIHNLDKSQVKSPSPKNKKYLSAEPLIEATIEEEQSTPLSQFRNQLKKEETPSQIKEPISRGSIKTENEQFNKMMSQKLEILNEMINSRIGNKKS